MLFFSRGFFPFFQTFFLGAFNDNLFRNALIIIITYQSGLPQGTASALSFAAMALLMFPQFPFSAIAGNLSDKYPQRKVFELIKLAEVILMALTLVAFVFKAVPLLLILIFLMGTQSAFYSPAKYSYVPRNMPGDLIRGDAWISAGTYIAVLLGAVCGNYLITCPRGPLMTGIALLLIALAGYRASRLIPDIPAANPDMKPEWNLFKGSRDILRIVFKNKILRRSVIGLSVFWMAGSIYVSQLAGFCRNVIGADERVVMIFTLLFSVGVAAGSVLCIVLQKHINTVRVISPALALMALFTADMFLASSSWTRPCAAEECVSFLTLCKIPSFWRFITDLIALSACGGLYSVPLTALIQKFAPAGEVSGVIAGNNIANAAMIAAGTLISAALMGCGIVDVKGLFLVIAAVNLFAAAYLLTLREKI